MVRCVDHNCITPSITYINTDCKMGQWGWGGGGVKKPIYTVPKVNSSQMLLVKSFDVFK